MNTKKKMLLQSAAELYRLGLDLETARERLSKLVKSGVSYESATMREADEIIGESKDG